MKAGAALRSVGLVFGLATAIAGSIVLVATAGAGLVAAGVHDGFSIGLPLSVWAATWYLVAHAASRGRTSLGARVARLFSKLTLLIALGVFVDLSLPLLGFTDRVADSISGGALLATVVAWTLLSMRGRTSFAAESLRAVLVLVVALVFVSQLWVLRVLELEHTAAIFAIAVTVIAVWSAPRIDRALESSGHLRLARRERPHTSPAIAVGLAFAVLWIIRNAVNASAVFEGLRPGGTYSLMNVLFPFSIVAAGELTHYFIEFVAPVAALVGIKVLADDDSLGLGLRAGLCYLALSTASQLVAPFASYGLKWHLPLWEQARALAFHLGAPLGFDALYWLLAANLASTALLLAARRLAGRAGRAKSEAEGEAAACLTSASSRTPSGTLVPERSASAEAPRR